MAEKTTGGAIIAQMLKEEGVEKFFESLTEPITQLFKNCVDMGMPMITPRHESKCGAHGRCIRQTDRKTRRVSGLERSRVANVLSGACVENAEGNRVLLITSSQAAGHRLPTLIGEGPTSSSIRWGSSRGCPNGPVQFLPLTGSRSSCAVG